MESIWQNNMGTEVICYGCPKLVENNFADRCSKGLLQYKGISAICRSLDIYLTGGEVPNWFEYRSTGYYLSFMASNKIQGWIACAVFTLPKKLRYNLDCPRYFIQKNFNRRVGVHEPYPFLLANMVHNINFVMWFSYLPLSNIDMPVKCGDEVEILLKTPEHLTLIEWGISLIHKDEEEEGEEEEGEEEASEEEGGGESLSEYLAGVGRGWVTNYFGKEEEDEEDEDDEDEDEEEGDEEEASEEEGGGESVIRYLAGVGRGWITNYFGKEDDEDEDEEGDEEEASEEEGGGESVIRYLAGFERGWITNYLGKEGMRRRRRGMRMRIRRTKRTGMRIRMRMKKGRRRRTKGSESCPKPNHKINNK